MQEKARRIIMNYFNDHVDVTDGKRLTMDDVFVVWFAKTLQNWKCLVRRRCQVVCTTKLHTTAIKTKPTLTFIRNGKITA